MTRRARLLFVLVLVWAALALATGVARAGTLAKVRATRYAPATAGQPRVTEVRLDDTGIASLAYVNRRNPPHVLRDLQEAFEACFPVRGPGCADESYFSGGFEGLRDAWPDKADEMSTAFWQADLGGTASEALERVKGPQPAVADTLKAIQEKRAAWFAAWLRQRPGMDTYLDDLRKSSGVTPEQSPLPNPIDPSGAWADVRLRFVNRSTTRDLVVTLTAPLGSAAACEDGNAQAKGGHWQVKDKLCVIALKVDANSSESDLDLWQLARAMGLRRDRSDGGVDYADSKEPQLRAVAFTVEPYDVESTLPRPRGAFILAHPPAPAPDELRWAGSFAPTALWEPGQDADAKGQKRSFSDAEPYRDEQLRHITGKGLLTFSQALSDRASGSVTFGYKSGDLGAASSTLAVSEYRFSVFGARGLSLDAGRFTFAKPSSGLAVNEEGDGARVNAFDTVSLGYIVRRESAQGAADTGNKDSLAWILHVNGIPGLFSGGLEGLSLTAVEGKDRCPKLEDGACTEPSYRYRTLGAELGFGVPKTAVRGTLALYHSRRWPIGAPVDKRGSVGLLTVSHTWSEARKPGGALKVRHQLTLRAGSGSGNKPTTDRDEGYLGERATFLPGSIFPSFLKAIDTGEAPVPAGFSNKDYIGVEWKTRLFSPLSFIATRLGSPADIASESTTLAFHRYRLREPLRGRHEAGDELVLSADVETPRGIRWSVSIARFLPGAALEPFVRKDPWALTMSVAIVTGK